MSGPEPGSDRPTRQIPRPGDAVPGDAVPDDAVADRPTWQLPDVPERPTREMPRPVTTPGPPGNGGRGPVPTAVGPSGPRPPGAMPPPGRRPDGSSPHPGRTRPGGPEVGSPGPGQPDAGRPAAQHPGAPQPGPGRPDAGRPGAVPPGAGPHGPVRVGASRPGLGQPGEAPSSPGRHGQDRPGAAQPGSAHPGGPHPSAAPAGPPPHGAVPPGRGAAPRPGPATAVPRAAGSGAPGPAPAYGGTPSVVVAGGGSAGHIEPALAVADAVRRLAPGATVTALGTEKGLDTQLIPARGYRLELIPPVPLPRKPTADLLKLPGNVRGAVRRVREVLRSVDADVVVGFGGFVSLPAYLGARGRTPIVVHEANARAGLANKVGARFAQAVAVAVAGTGLPGEQVVGMPLRRSITELDRHALRSEARRHFGLPPAGPVLLVFGGSQGARTLNSAVAAALPGLVDAGVAVLHAHGRGGTPAPPMSGYRPLPYIERMDLAYAAADVVLGRSGMTTVAELTAVGLPAVYVPLPHGNGEQALNCRPVVDAGGGVLVPDEDLTGDRALAELLPLLTDPSRALDMGHRARLAGHGDADERMARIVLDVIG